jgi:flagellar biosynthesis protein FlhG
LARDHQQQLLKKKIDVSPTPSVTDQTARIVSVGSGKGGVGKSVFVTNLAAHLAASGQRVILVDTDLESANLHTLLGVRPPPISLADFVAQRESELAKLVFDTHIPNLSLIAGTHAHVELPQPGKIDRARLLRALRRLPADWVLLDLGAGARASVLDYFLTADDQILVLDAEPTSVESTYHFLRAAFYRRMKEGLQSHAARDLMELAMDRGNERGIRTPLELLGEITELDPQEGARFRAALRQFHPRLVVNKVRTAEEIKLGFSVRSVCSKYFGIGVDYLGYVSRDPAVPRSVLKRQPVVMSDPRCDASVYIGRIAEKLQAEDRQGAQVEEPNSGKGRR